MLILPFVLANLVKPIPPPPPKYHEVVMLHVEHTELKTTETLPKPVEQPLEQQKPLVAVTAVKGSSGAYNGYDAGQCTYGVKLWKPEIPNNWGNASSWLTNARAIGWPNGPLPAVGAVGTRLSGNHVVLVIGIIDSATITIREMNYDYVPFHERIRQALASEFYYIY